MPEKILCVDDDPNILAAYTRRLRKDFDLDIASSALEGLEKIGKTGPYAVVVSDMQMPGMNGIEFLARVKLTAPETVRIMLTGQGDLSVAMNAVNQGNIFRFLTKPCPPEELAFALHAGIEQYNLVIAEKVLLEKTLKGAVKVLSDVLSMVNPTAFGRASRVRRVVRQLCTEMGLELSWKIELGAMLSQIGCVIVPEATLKKAFEGKALLTDELRMYLSHPLVGRDLINRIPRLEEVAEIIAYQEKLWSGGGIPRDTKKGSEIPLGSRLLKIALDFDILKAAGHTSLDAYTELMKRTNWYDPDALKALRSVLDLEISYEVRAVNIDQMTPGMILAEDVRGMSGTLLIANGQEVSKSLLLRLRNFAFTAGIKQPIKVFVPRSPE
jgi:response regulator RpfG family c-di-GMP phosphodiesterase